MMIDFITSDKQINNINLKYSEKLRKFHIYIFKCYKLII